MAGVWAAICSICWFAAFLNHEVAPVRAVGQVELLFSIGFSVLYFKERVSRLELAGNGAFGAVNCHGVAGLEQFSSSAETALSCPAFLIDKPFAQP